MNYERFMRELLSVIMQREEAAGKQIRLLEKSQVCMDWEAPGQSCEDVLCITWEVRKQVHILHWKLEYLYKQFCREGWQSVLPEIVWKLRHQGAYGEQKCQFNRMIVRPLSYALNKIVLKDSIYWKFGDIAMVLYLLVDDGEEYTPVCVNRELANRWNVPDEILLTNAMLHTCSTLPPRLYRGGDIQGYRLTNSGGADGALSFFYPGMRERLAFLLEGDYYVGFLNINEAAIFPVKRKMIGELRAAVLHANAMLDERERLTDRIYRYSSTYKRLIEV